MERTAKKTSQEAWRLIGELRAGRIPANTEELGGEWEGARSTHFGHNNNYRLIWEYDEEIRTFKVLAVERKKKYGKTIYEGKRPTWE